MSIGTILMIVALLVAITVLLIGSPSSAIIRTAGEKRQGRRGTAR
jgi:hypothetical protein